MKLLHIGPQWINVGIVRLFREIEDSAPRIELVYEDDATLAVEGSDAIALRQFLVMNCLTVAPGPVPTDFSQDQQGPDRDLPPEIYRREEGGG